MFTAITLQFVVIFNGIFALTAQFTVEREKDEIYRTGSGCTAKTALAAKASRVKYHGTTRTFHLPPNLSIYKAFDSKTLQQIYSEQSSSAERASHHTSLL